MKSFIGRSALAGAIALGSLLETGVARADPLPCSSRESEIWDAVAIAGGFSLWFTYGASAIGAAGVAFDEEPAKFALARSPSGHRVSSTQAAWLAVPGAGPFLTAAKLPKLDPHGPMDDRATRKVLIGDGIAQSVGLGAVAIGSLGSLSARCHRGYAPSAKNDAPGDMRMIPLFMGGLFLGLFYPIAEIFSVQQDRDTARLWALVPGPGAFVAAAKMSTKVLPDAPQTHSRAAYITLGVAETSALLLMASTPLWPSRPSARMPEVSIGPAAISAKWTF